jgi:NAD(P)-dependent dehydrogenase (short-subunit alcohol dehydrogenase family)
VTEDGSERRRVFGPGALHTVLLEALRHRRALIHRLDGTVALVAGTRIVTFALRGVRVIDYEGPDEGAVMETNDDSRTWLITGASSGLGRALADAVLERGHRVMATGRNEERLADLIERYPGSARAFRLDVTEADQARAAVEEAISAFVRLDVLVSNAGYGLFGALEELSDEDLRRQFDTNVFGCLNVTRAALPHLRRQRSGHIVQISSLEGIAPAVAGESAYAGTKFAVEGIAEGLAKDVHHLGIRVTIVEPGPLRTDFASGSTAIPPQSEDYADSVGEALAWFQDLTGNQPNDPRRVAEAIIAAIDADEPPLRLVLGEEALRAVRGKLEDQQRDRCLGRHQRQHRGGRMKVERA